MVGIVRLPMDDSTERAYYHQVSHRVYEDIRLVWPSLHKPLPYVWLRPTDIFGSVQLGHEL